MGWSSIVIGVAGKPPTLRRPQCRASVSNQRVDIYSAVGSEQELIAMHRHARRVHEHTE